MESATKKPAPGTNEDARKVFRDRKIALFVVAYNAENHIQKALSRIPEWCRPLFSEIYVIDDSSEDGTLREAIAAGQALNLKNFSVMKTPKNQGYGGNQKIGYTYAIERNHDIVILLHGDGQYPPENIPEMVACYRDEKIDAVFGSRMIVRSHALQGGMPLYKWIGNQILTATENAILKTKLSEFHSGYRSYRISALEKIPFHLNSDDFHFDTDIIIQLVLQDRNILEIPIPTYYGDEECHVNGMKYAWNCFKSATKSRLHQAGIFFQPNFEFAESEGRNYHLKRAKTSLHAFILSLPWRPHETVADLGANDGRLAEKIAEKGPTVTAVDLCIPQTVPGVKTVRIDLNIDFDGVLEKKSFDKIIALDILEHLHIPERAAERIHALLKPHGRLYASTANIGYIIMRFTHLFGWFNYGKRGILDRTHCRLFTIGSFKRLLQNAGFTVVRIEGFGPPIIDTFGDSFFWQAVDHICWSLAKAYPKLFAFNFLVIADKRTSVQEKTAKTVGSKQQFSSLL